jgi:hypothetical protein
MGESPGPEQSTESPNTPSRTWKGPIPWLLLSLPWLGGMLVVLVSTLVPRPDPAYRALEDRLGYWSPRSRAILSQLYMGHALSSGLEPREAMVCARQISNGEDLSPCTPSSGQGAAASAALLSDLADFVIQHAPPRDDWRSDTERHPAEESQGGFYFGDSPGDLESDSNTRDTPAEGGRVFNPDAI